MDTFLLCRIDWRAAFRALSALFPEGRGQPQTLGGQTAAYHIGIGGVSAPGRTGGKAFVDFGLEVALLDLVQGKGAQGIVRLEAGLQAGPEKGRETPH